MAPGLASAVTPWPLAWRCSGQQTKSDGVFDRLTPREAQVMMLIARGLSNQEIAARLYLSEPTVKTHVTRVFAKVGVHDRVHAVVLAYEAGLVRPGGAGGLDEVSPGRSTGSAT